MPKEMGSNASVDIYHQVRLFLQPAQLVPRLSLQN
jgi:hypothetical protein